LGGPLLRVFRGGAGGGRAKEGMGGNLIVLVFVCHVRFSCVEASVSVFGRKREKSMTGTSRGSKWIGYRGRSGIVERNDKIYRLTPILGSEDCAGFGRVKAAEWRREDRWPCD
jgi:hypothetical protein